MFCPSCGNKLPENSRFCPQCGKSCAPGKSKMPVIVAVCAVVIVLLAVLVVLFLPKNAAPSNVEVAPTEALTAAVQEAVTEEPTIEEAPAQKVNLLETMTKEEKKALNIFLSNFSEAYYKTPYSENDSDTHEMISFAYLHNSINNPGKTVYYGEYEGISVSNANTTLEKYFGKTVAAQTVSGSTSYSHDWVCDGANFLKPAADGEAYEYFSIASNMVDNSDGTYTVDFNVYFDDAHMHEGVPSGNYYFTTSQAAENCSYEYYGTAVVKKKVYNNKNTYELIDYNTTK